MIKSINKPNGFYEKKSFTGQVADIDLKNRIVTGYWSGFGNIDHDNDKIVKGAFAKSIKERGPLGTKEIFFLNQHNWSQPLGFPQVLEERELGLYHETPVTVETNYANDALKCMAAGLVVQNSIGFVTLKWNNVNPDGDWGEKFHREILEVKLYEGSCVTLGANSETPFTGFKNLTLPQLNDQISKMVKLLKDGDLTDEGFARLEIGLKQLQREAFELGKNSVEVIEPDNGSTQKDGNPNIIESNFLESFVNVLENKN